MAKSDLIGGTLWESYSRKVNDRMLNPRHLGEITAADAAEAGRAAGGGGLGRRGLRGRHPRLLGRGPRDEQDPGRAGSRPSAAARPSPPAT